MPIFDNLFPKVTKISLFGDLDSVGINTSQFSDFQFKWKVIIIPHLWYVIPLIYACILVKYCTKKTPKLVNISHKMVAKVTNETKFSETKISHILKHFHSYFLNRLYKFDQLNIIICIFHSLIQYSYHYEYKLIMCCYGNQLYPVF